MEPADMTATMQLLLDEGEKTGFATVEAFGETIDKWEYQWFPEDIPALHSVESSYASVRAFWETGGPVGFTLSRPGQAAIKSAFSTIYSTHLPGQEKNRRLELPGSIKKVSPAIYDPSAGKVDLKTFNALIGSIAEALLTPAFRGLNMTEARLTRTLKKVYIANSNGLTAKYRKTLFTLGLSFSMGSNRIDISENRVYFHRLEPHKVIGRAFNLLNSLTDTPAPFSSAKAANLPLILSPEASVFILKEFSGYFKIGTDKEITGIHYPSILNVVDHPLMDDQPGSAPFDDEGVQGKSSGTYLIKKGVFERGIADTAAAFRHGTVSTGNGFRNHRSPFPFPRFSNLFIKPTVLPLKNLMSDAGTGILVLLLRLKSIDKEGYLFSAYGYRFSGGEIGEPVHFYFKTTFRSYFLNILKVSAEIRFFYSTYNIGSPYLLLEAQHKSGDTFTI